MEKTKPNNTKRDLPPVAYWILAGVALGCSYLAISVAIDTGSLLSYGAALVMFGLGIKNLMQGMNRSKERSK